MEDNIKFYLMPSLETFDGILGNDTLREIGAVIFTSENIMTLKNGFKVSLKQLPTQCVNAIKIDEENLSTEQKEGMKK